MNTTANAGAPEKMVHVFVSYAREDQKWLDPQYRCNLIPFLAESLRKHDVAFWFDKELKPGDEFKRHIESQIDQAQIALLIVSQNFLNSAFIETEEIPRIAERAKHGQILVVPVLVEPCDWSDYPFLADRQMVPSSPLIEYTESESQWAKVKYQILDGLKAQVKRTRGTLRPAEPLQERTKPSEPVLAWTPPPAQQPQEVGRVPIAVTQTASQAGASTRRPGEWSQQGATVASSRSWRIPVWAWGAVSALLLGAVFVGVHSNSHSAPGAPEPTQEVPGTPVPGEPAPSAPAAAPTLSPAPGASSGNGPLLRGAMSTIQAEMSSIGKIGFTALVRNTADGSTFQYTQTEQVTNVVADPAQCRVSFHHTVWQNGAVQPTLNKTSWFMLHDVVSIVVMPGGQHLTGAFAHAGKANFIATSIAPPVTYVVLLSEPEGWTNEPIFIDSESANRFANTVRLAVRLCGGPAANK